MRRLIRRLLACMLRVVEVDFAELVSLPHVVLHGDCLQVGLKCR
jgi:hypothetical protein